MVPDLTQILQVSHQYKDGMPLQWAVVDNGDVAFYSFNDVDLPVDTSSD